jgi:hypothetical protein
MKQRLIVMAAVLAALLAPVVEPAAAGRRGL